PFPGPGLAIRCLCSGTEAVPERVEEGWILPVRSVGVQGDSRTYRPVLALASVPAWDEETADVINRRTDVNRIVGIAHTCKRIGDLKVRPAYLTAKRLDRLRRADAIVRRISLASGF